ncbi:ABC transporter substrate-binding protein [Ornithinimicrobium pratense]|uniref:ABC transporter substrate-binding protein n=1 Tax=Ornithinimicrobium pratense TaxID=2593973 RepID=A0A5J6V7H6_9MICO|nr:ABC transporter substrate-binding protein [Ornithinimicrobium pratense]QFG69081.1 ABC transporter substrate-binding protein [Ornithinimicrobium pratense]
MNRPITSLLGLSLTATLLAACAGGSADDDGTTDGGGGGAASDEEVTSLTFWSNHPGSSKEVEEQLIAAYEEETGISINLVTAGANYEEVANRFNAAQAGSDVPDIVIASDVTWFPMMLNDAIAPLDDLWEAQGSDTDSYVDALREDYLYDDQHFAVPYARSTPLFYYNKEMWQAAGLPDRGPETWDEFAEWADDLREANSEMPALVLPDGSNYLDWHFQGMIWTFDGAYSHEWDTEAMTSEGSIAAGEFLQGQVESGNFVIATDPNSDFAAGQAAALLQSTGSLGGLTEAATFEFGTAFLPGPQPGVTTGGAGLAVSSKISEARKAAAVDFLDWYTSTPNTVTFSQSTGYVPVRKDAVDTDEVQAYLEENPNFRTAVEQLPNTQSQDYARVFVPGGGARIGAALDRITTGGEDVTEVFTQLAEDTQQVVERDVEPELR